MKRFTVRTFKALMTVMIFLVAINAITACGKKNSDAGSPEGVAITGPLSCAAGQVYHTTYGCLNRAQCAVGQGYASQINQCVAGQIIDSNYLYGGSASKRYGYGLQGINRSQFELMMREYGQFCDQYTWNWGAASCSAYSNQGFVIVELFQGGLQAQVTIGAGASTPDNNYYYSGTNYYPMHFQGTVYPINNGTGFEIRADGAAYPGTLLPINEQGLRILVNSGTMNNTSFNAQIYYRNVQIGSAPLTQY